MATDKMANYDFIVIGKPGDTMFLATPVSEGAKDYLAMIVEVTDPGEVTFLGNSIAIEHRYIEDWITGMSDDGWWIADGWEIDHDDA